MQIAEAFKRYERDFEVTFRDDDWSRLLQYFSDDAKYITRGFESSTTTGRANVLRVLKNNISNFDRRCSSRVLQTIEGPVIEGSILSRTWQSRYELDGCRGLVVSGREIVHYQDGLIQTLEEEFSEDSKQAMTAWLSEYGSRLKLV